MYMYRYVLVNVSTYVYVYVFESSLSVARMTLARATPRRPARPVIEVKFELLLALLLLL